jgi:hypothetical protein
MATEQLPGVLGQIAGHAFRTLDFSNRSTTNLYLDRAVRKPGTHIGPDFQKIRVERPTIVVFADDMPLANFAHPCRYLLYDSENGRLDREVPARFPPFVEHVPETLIPLHEPVRIDPNPELFHIRWPFWCPIFWPDGDRYAILFSGMSNLRHVNDLEFLYRALVNLYGFDPEDIYVLNYDGTLATWDTPPTTWPGDGTAYQMNVTGQGTRAGFEAAIDDLKGKLKAHDLLLIHTNNHGDWDGTAGTAKICTYPNFGGYYANDFANKIAELPKYRSLIVMMEQCHAGGFNAPILAKSTADATSVASAVTEPNLSWGSADGHWDCFARDWISAQTGHDPYGAALASNPDTNGNGRIEAEEAFGYANSIHFSGDSPNFSESSEAGGDIWLGQQYVIWWWWCWIIFELLEPHYRRIPDPEYYELLRKLEPEFAKLVTTMDRASDELRKMVEPELKRLIEAAVGGRR